MTLSLRADELGYHTQDGRYVVEPGPFDVWVGPCSEGELKSSISVL